MCDVALSEEDHHKQQRVALLPRMRKSESASWPSLLDSLNVFAKSLAFAASEAASVPVGIASKRRTEPVTLRFA